MNDVLIINNFRQTDNRGYNEVSADVDGERVFFSAPLKDELAVRAEPFLGVTLLEAMIRNIDIRIDCPVPLSKELYERLPEIQSIYASWNSDLHRINIIADIAPHKDKCDRISSFFSGGVDGSHTLYRNIDKITHLIFLLGFEMRNTPEFWQYGVKAQTEFAQDIGKKLIPVETNAKQWTDQRKIHWGFAQGLVLSAMGSLLKSKQIYIAASHTYNELFPWGSHPLTDPMWSTESTKVIHDGASHRRGEKMKDLCNNQKILDNLRVCWENDHSNCGKCPKCARTITALYLLGASSKALPKFDDNFEILKRFKATEESGATFLEDAIIMAKNAKNEKIYRILKRYFRIYQTLQVMKILDRYMLGGAFRKVYRKFKKIRHPKAMIWRVGVRGNQP